MSKKLFTISASDVNKAYHLLEGLSRYDQLLQDIAFTETVGFPIELSNGKKIKIEYSTLAFIAVIEQQISLIKNDLDELGISYE